MFGHDLEMYCAKFQANRFKIDGEVDEKHALQIIMCHRLYNAIGFDSQCHRFCPLGSGGSQ